MTSPRQRAKAIQQDFIDRGRPDYTGNPTAPVKVNKRHYDYTNQAWIVNGRYVSCGHPDIMSTGHPCNCYGRLHAGELASKQKEN